MFKKLFLPVGMLVTLAIALLWPASGTWMKPYHANDLFIVLIFLVCGWQTNVSEMKLDRKFIFLFVAGALVTLGIAPWIAKGIGMALALPALPVVGLVVISAMPPTLSSGIVMTENAEGNTFLSMMMTIGYNLLGVFVLPLVLPLLLAGSGDIDTHPLRMLIQLFLLVVVPFFIGFLGKKLTGKKLPWLLGYIPSLCVLLLLLSFFSSSYKSLKAFPMKVLLLSAAGSLVTHLILLAIMWFGGRFCRYPVRDCKALIFTGASKTLTLGLTTLAIMKADNGEAVVPCLIFYFLQMLIDSSLAGKMGIAARKAAEKAEAAEGKKG